MSGGVTHYDVMPIPPVDAQTRWFDAGAVAFGVEYRLLNEAIAAAHVGDRAVGSDPSDGPVVDDCGVSIHVCDNRGPSRVEHLRFDCFAEDPHYHYISWTERSNDMVHMDPVADGDPLSWALGVLRSRLPQMLARAGAEAVARALEPDVVERVLPRVAEAAYRARYQHDDAEVLRDALAGRTS